MELATRTHLTTLRNLLLFRQCELRAEVRAAEQFSQAAHENALRPARPRSVQLPRDTPEVWQPLEMK